MINRQDWIVSAINDNILKDKKKLQTQYIWYMLNRTQSLFKYENLPDSIPQKDLELLLQVNGFAVFAKVKDELYAFYGGLGGEPNVYYLPTKATIANPALAYSATLEIDKECVVVLNDSIYIGLVPMFQKYSALLTESDITLRFNCINARTQSLIVADSDTARKSAEIFLQDIEDGKKLGVIASDKFFEGLKTEQYNNTETSIKDSIEFQQYIKASWYNDLGLNANYNMKREAINDAEAGMNDDILLPLIDDMLNQRRLGLDKVNAMFGTNITVDFNSSWKRNIEELDLSLEALENEVENTEEPVQQDTEMVEETPQEEEVKDEETKREDSVE